MSDEAKTKLVSAPVLTHYDPNLPIQMAGDASQYEAGAVISHIMPDGSEKPIAFASRNAISPYSLLVGSDLHMRLDLLKPDVDKQV